jgi:hypothetical protein
VQVVLGAGGQYEPDGTFVGGLRRRRDTFGRDLVAVDGIVFLAGEVLHRASGQAHLDAQPDRLRHRGRLVRVTILQVGRDWQVRRRDDDRGVHQGFVSAHRAVVAAQGGGEA